MSAHGKPNGSSAKLDLAFLSDLSDLSEKGQLRSLRTRSSSEANEVEVDGKRLLSFGSNDYLGMAAHPALKLAAESALNLGSGATGSRLTTGNLALHERLEEEIAAFKHAAAAIVFSSGYAANIGVIPALVDSRDLILSDELNHASLIDGCRLSRAKIHVYRHNNLDDLRRLLDRRADFRRLLVVTDGVFSMDGDLAPLPGLADLCDEFDGWLMVDDAHGTGVYGRTGRGVVEHFDLRSRVPVQMGTLSKAVGTAGGFAAGSTTLIDLLRNKARSFMFSTAPPPAVIAASREAIRLIDAEPERRHRLMGNIRQLVDGLRGLGFPAQNESSPIIPLIIGTARDAVDMSNELEKSGFWVPAIRPPTVPQGTSRLRITVTAAHSEEEISALVSAIGSVTESHR